MERGISGPMGVTEDRGKVLRVSPGSNNSDSNEPERATMESCTVNKRKIRDLRVVFDKYT